MWADYLLFLLRVVTIVVAIGVIIGLVAAAVGRNSGQGKKGRIETEDLSRRFERVKEQVQAAVTQDKKALKRWFKTRKQEQKDKKKTQQGDAEHAYVLDFKGDIQASQVKALSNSVTAVLAVAKAGEKVVVRLESPGGVVHGYGLAASQLARLKAHGLTVWVTVDKVAASGGYMMAALADRIYAAPFAIVGSIGVVAQLPNIHRLLKKHDIDVELHTAGDFKRTLTVLGENTRSGREKFQQDLENTHLLFKQHVAKARPSLDVDSVSDGDFWYGQDALAKGLVDELATSEDVLLGLHNADCRLLRVGYSMPQPLAKRLGGGAVGFVETAFDRFMSRNTPWQ